LTAATDAAEAAYRAQAAVGGDGSADGEDEEIEYEESTNSDED